MFYCSSCGNAVADGAAFCSACGRPLQAPAQNNPTPNYAVPNNPTPNNSIPNYPPQYQYRPVVFERPKVPGRGFGITSMVLGILSVIYGLGLIGTVTSEIGRLSRYSWLEKAVSVTFVQILTLVSVLSILSFIFSTVSIKKGYKNGISVAGLAMSIIGFVFFAVSLVILLVNT